MEVRIVLGIFGIAGILFILTALHIFSGSSKTPNPAMPENTSNTSKNVSVIYIAYSPSCPHCYHLLEYVSKLNLKNVSILTTQNGREVYALLKKYNYNWDFGVPIVFTEVNGKLIIIKGYPSKEQDKEGYFIGEEYERKLCESLGGKKEMSNGKYLFCWVKNNEILGNKYAIDYLINLCEENLCNI